MSHGYVPVQWNKNKKKYDIMIGVVAATYLIIFFAVSMFTHTGKEALAPVTIIMRAFGSLGFILLTIILTIGPLARIDNRFLPLLYNRRHLGVSMFFIVLIHGVLAIIWYHGFGTLNPIDSLFTAPGSLETAADVPFQIFGFFALIIFFLMAATSHDYWNANLGAPVWKALHMLVYLAYTLVITHVAFGAMQDKTVGLVPALVIGSVVLVGVLHLVSAMFFSKSHLKAEITDWINVGSWRDIGNNSAKIINTSGDERVAVFRYNDNKIAAVSNVCQHQNGPLGEGCVIDGFITCPWHGFQYRPEDGCSPAPFTEKIATYEVKLEGENVMLNPKGLPPGSPRPIVTIDSIVQVSNMEAATNE